MGTAWQLGSDQYRRWVARVLNAPYDPQIISHGQVSATSAAIALEQCPIFKKAFSEQRPNPAFVSDLLTQVLSDEGADNMWAKYGEDTNRFASRGELENGLLEFRSVLLWDQSSQDITPEQIQNALAPLAGTSLVPTATPSLDTVNEVLKQIGQPGRHDEPHIAMEALILWVGYMRKINIDPVHLTRPDLEVVMPLTLDHWTRLCCARALLALTLVGCSLGGLDPCRRAARPLSTGSSAGTGRPLPMNAPVSDCQPVVDGCARLYAIYGEANQHLAFSSLAPNAFCPPPGCQRTAE